MRMRRNTLTDDRTVLGTVCRRAKVAAISIGIWALAGLARADIKPRTCSKKKDLSLDSRLTVTSTGPDGDVEIVTRKSEVTSLSQEDLSDDLFLLPVGYTKIVSP